MRLQGQQQVEAVCKEYGWVQNMGHKTESGRGGSQSQEPDWSHQGLCVYKKALKYCVLQTPLSAFRALMHSGFSVTETSQSQLLIFSSISVNSLTCWWLVTCWSPVGHYTFGVLNDIFQVNTRVFQLGLQLNQSPVTTPSSAETCYVLIVALTKCKYLFLLLFLIIQYQGSKSGSLSRLFSEDAFYWIKSSKL